MKMNGIIRTLLVGGVCVAGVACSGNQNAEKAAAEQQQAVVHGLFAVSSAGNEIDVSADGRHDDNSVDAEGDERQKNKLQ